MQALRSDHLSEASLLRLVTLCDLADEKRRTALTDYGAKDVFRAVDWLDRRGPGALGQLAELLGGQLPGMAKLKAMMVGRIVRLDLSKPLTPETHVELVAPNRGQLEAAQ
ncbi:hypothetical protein [Caulobacter sp. LjRoot300]|uniref:hypothetical protein n=1 Tax=Caulobacter sp. LjRoot300 TaxID=3342321 RepID=UPI003ECCFC3D